MKISEIKNKELRQLAELRRDQRDKNKTPEFSDVLDEAFIWDETNDGDMFWVDVYSGDITELTTETQPKDQIVESVIRQYKQRSDVGIAKYGQTMDRDDLSLTEWLNHLQQELMDATLYIEKLKEEVK